MSSDLTVHIVDDEAIWKIADVSIGIRRFRSQRARVGRCVSGPAAATQEPASARTTPTLCSHPQCRGLGVDLRVRFCCRSPSG